MKIARQQIGWIGLGKMGIPMSKSLISSGYNLIVYNRNSDKAEILRLPGAKSALNPAELVDNSDVIIIMVTDDNAIREIFTSADGLLASKGTGRIVINMSTVSPAVSSEMAILCEINGNVYIDAPVSGSVKQAEEATLVIMAGGDEAVFDKVRAILEHMGRLVLLVGGIGSGNKAKLIINSLLAVYAQGLVEAVLFARELRIQPEDLINLISNSALGSPLLRIKGDMLLNQNFNASFTLKNLAKDLRLAKDIGLSLPMGNAAYQNFQEAAINFPEEDIISIIKHLDK
jgi:3-hydroxyisobutyrate dehydrogenase